jgi:hypothetical protein
LKSHVVDADPERDQPGPGAEGAGDLACEHVGAGGAALTEVQELERRVRRAELADQPIGIPAAGLGAHADGGGVAQRYVEKFRRHWINVRTGALPPTGGVAAYTGR